MGARGTSPGGWAILALATVAYAHVLLELALAVLLLAAAVRLLGLDAARALSSRIGRGRDGQALRGEAVPSGARPGSADEAGAGG
jgi:hypothetical protein